MSKGDILELLETDMADPGSFKSGEYLREHVLIHAGAALADDRKGLVEALREWLNFRTDPRTMLAVTVASKLSLKELKPDIETLKVEVMAGKFFPRFYLRNIQAALDMLGEK